MSMRFGCGDTVLARGAAGEDEVPEGVGTIVGYVVCFPSQPKKEFTLKERDTIALVARSRATGEQHSDCCG